LFNLARNKNQNKTRERERERERERALHHMRVEAKNDNHPFFSLDDMKNTLLQKDKYKAVLSKYKKKIKSNKNGVFNVG
jgi:hypothetical protein